MAGNISFPSPEAGQSFYFDTSDSVHNDLARNLFIDSEVGAWAEDRQERYPEYIKPRIMYIAPYGESEVHHVAWVYHRGIRPLMNDGDFHTQYAVHHVACDCLGWASEGQESIEAVMNCTVVNKVLGVRAQELASEFRNSELLAELGESAEAIRELMVTTMLERDHTRPETWMANLRSGALVVSALARTLSADRREILPLLDAMQARGMVEHDTYQARLGLAAFE